MSDLWLFYHFRQLLTAVSCQHSFSYVCFNFIYVLFAFPNSIYIYFGAIYIFLILYLFYPMCDIATYRAGASWPAKKCRTVAIVSSIVFVFKRRVIVTSALPNINLPLANFYSFHFTGLSHGYLMRPIPILVSVLNFERDLYRDDTDTYTWYCK